MNTVPLIGICRHRLVSDGQGVTTLMETDERAGNPGRGDG